MKYLHRWAAGTLLIGLLSCSTEPVPHQSANSPIDRPIASDAPLLPDTTVPSIQTPTFPTMPVDTHQQRGRITQYEFSEHGRLTHSGDTYDVYALTAAHSHWPMGTYVSAKDLQQRRQVVVRINDRLSDGTALRVSRQAAQQLGLSPGTSSTMLYQALATTPPSKTSLRVPLVNPKIEAMYYIQAGAFRSAQNAQQLGQQLGTLPHSIRIQPGQGLYRVQLGPLPHQQARQLLMQLPQYDVNSAFLVPVIP